MTKRERKQIPDYKLLCKIVWYFKRKSRESWEDLFQEGYLGYLRAIETHNPSKGAFSTHAWYCIHSTIQDYIKLEVRKNGHFLPIPNTLQVTETTHSLAYDIVDEQEQYISFFDNLPVESQIIATEVLRDPVPYLLSTKEAITSRLTALLSEDKGLPLNRICFGLRGLQMACNS